jgi:hypothetical protein
LLEWDVRVVRIFWVARAIVLSGLLGLGLSELFIVIRFVRIVRVVGVVIVRIVRSPYGLVKC